MKGFFRLPTPEDIEHVAAHMRDCDRAEIEASSGRTPLEVLQQGVESSGTLARAGVLDDGEPVSILGCAPLRAPIVKEKAGTPWLLATDRADAHGRAFIREGRRLCALWLTEYELLVNAVDARNTKSVAWLKHIGFDILPPQPMGILQLPFHPFGMRRQLQRRERSA